jgi:hypothetical protein
MAPKKPENTKSSNRIRFIMLDADISDGNLTELTQAITSALRPATAPLRQIARPSTPVLTAPNDAIEDPQTNEQPDDQDAQEPADGNGASSKPSRAKKFKAPDYLPSLLAGEKRAAFKQFAKDKAPENKSKKYLVATYWLKEHGESPTVNANKIYTCFKTAGWSTGFNDWNQTFHNLVHSEHLRKEGTGEFAINPLGEDAVVKGEE